MVFIETPVFTKQVQKLLSDELYGELQQYLAANPNTGDRIKDTGGLRKVRWSTEGGGKRGGVRVIYFYVVADANILMLLIYGKGTKDDLSADEKKTLRKIVKNW
jgi:mRNA-degrading endonuclease RelE of RelBE toxin-antitoxin system